MSSVLSGFSTPVGIVTAIDTSLLVGGFIWARNKFACSDASVASVQVDLKTMVGELKKHQEEIAKISEFLRQNDLKSLPKMALCLDNIVQNLGVMGQRFNAIGQYLATQEKSQETRDSNMKALFDYLAEKDPDGAPVYEEIEHPQRRVVKGRTATSRTHESKVHESKVEDVTEQALEQVSESAPPSVPISKPKSPKKSKIPVVPTKKQAEGATSITEILESTERTIPDSLPVPEADDDRSRQDEDEDVATIVAAASRS